jgi:hypothetical protein
MYSGPRFLGAVPLARRPVSLSSHLSYLGAMGAEGYAQAKAAVAKFDALRARVDKLANAASKAAIVKWLGTLAEVPEGAERGPLSRYQTVLNTVKAYGAETDPAKKAALYDRAEESRIEKLEAFNVELEPQVVAAEKGGVVTPPPAPETKQFPWVPVGIAAAAVAVAVGIIAFSGSSKS